MLLPRPNNQKAKSLTELVKENGSPRAQADEFWYQPDDIDANRWDQQYPYQLLVVAQKEGAWKQLPEWKFTLPVPPESLRIQMPFASQVHVTLGGVVEENAGAPIRIISIRGSTGFMAGRPSSTTRQERGPLEAILTGSTAAFERTANRLGDLVDGVLENDRRTPNVLTKDELADLLPGTGYYQMRVLQRFLERYAKFRLTKEGRNTALAVAIWKQEAVYLCTPMSFDLDQSTASPLEYMYNLTLRAWRRVKLDAVPALKSAHAPGKRDPNILNKVLNAIEDTRRVLQGARTTIQAVGGDVERLFEILREGSLLVKDVLGVRLALADLPSSILRDARDAMLAVMSAGDDVVEVEKLAAAKNRQAARDYEQLKQLVDELRDRNTTATGFSGNVAKHWRGNTPTSQPLGAAVASRAPMPAFDMFDRPQDHYDLLNLVPIDRLELQPQTLVAIDAERTRVSRLTRVDFETRRQELLTTAAEFADAVGAGSATYNKTVGRPAPQATRPVSAGDYKVMFALNQAAVAFAKMSTFSSDTAEESRLTGLEQVAVWAAKAGIEFIVPKSKFAVPFPYGGTLEQLAASYLGDANRWHEIAALNGLRTPYVDEEGFILPLLAPGSGNEVITRDSTQLYVGQTVWIGSDSVLRTKRRVLAVDRRDGLATLTLSGDADLQQYSTMHNAVLHGFEPGTVNSQMLIFIPSDKEPDGGFRTHGIPDASQFDTMAAVGGVDLLLDSKNDLVVTPDGDGRWAVGLTNLTQQFRIVMGVRQGSLNQHPSFGTRLQPGDNTGDVTPDAVVDSIRSALQGDPAFQTIRTIQVSKNGPTARLTTAVEIAGTNITLPLSVDVLR